MSQTPIKGMNKFHTISMEDKFSKNGFATTTAYRLTQRKSNSVLANPQNLSTTLISIDHPNLSLPKINKKKKEKKQGTFLQSWLDEALGAPDPFAPQKQSDQQKIEGNVLKTLKKYDLDKRHLQSQNIPGEKVEKLYKSLYIYSHGVNKIFEDLLQLTRQKGNNELIGNFWKAYTKLLESCTSYQTVFQKVERDHLENINRLKRAIQTRTESFEEQKKELQAKLNKLEKKNEEKENLYNNLKGQFDVLQNTLDLTDEAFNQEVNLRLKFEEKINAVYTSYEQLKNKYHKIVEEMGIKNIDLMERQNKQDELKSKLLAEKTKVDQLIFLLKAERDKVSERQSEIIIKTQELEDARSTIMAKSNQEDNTHDKIEEFLTKMKALRARIIEVENVSIGQKITIKQQEEHIKKLGKSLEQYKLHNDEVYEKYARSGKRIVNLESEIEKNNIKIIDLEKCTKEKSIQIADISRELSHVKNERDNLQHELNISCRNLKDASDTVGKNTVLLEEMKATKDKYERINQYLKESIKDLENSNNRLSQELSVKTEQIQGMKLLLESRSKALAQAEKQIQQQRQIAKTKLNSLNTLVAKKEALSLEYQKKKDEQEKQIADAKVLLNMTEDKCILLDSEKLKLEVQLSSKIKMLKELEQVLDKQSLKYKELNVKFEGQMKQKSDIHSKLETTEFVLKTKNEQERVQVISLSALLNEYKAKIIQRAQYVHPMLYEQALQTARRCANNEQKAKKDSIKFKDQSSELTQEFKKLQQLVNVQKQKIASIQLTNSALSEQKVKLFDKVGKLQKSVKEKTNLYQNIQITCSNLKQEIERKNKAQENLKAKKDQLEVTITNLKIKVEELVMEAKKKSRSQTRDVKRQVKKISSQQETQTQLMQEKPENKIEIPKIQTAEQEVQTQQIQQFAEKSDVMPAMYSQVNKQLRQQPLVKKQETPHRKIENKDFRKALKLTYMRR